MLHPRVALITRELLAGSGAARGRGWRVVRVVFAGVLFVLFWGGWGGPRWSEAGWVGGLVLLRRDQPSCCH